MITNFTGAYKLVDVDIMEYSGDRVVLPNDLYNVLHSGYDPTIPLLMKLAGSYFAVYGENAVPSDTLAIPKSRDFVTGPGMERDQALAVKAEYVKALFPHL